MVNVVSRQNIVCKYSVFDKDAKIGFRRYESLHENFLDPFRIYFQFAIAPRILSEATILGPFRTKLNFQENEFASISVNPNILYPTTI
jgi:hypothetical protein